MCIPADQAWGWWVSCEHVGKDQHARAVLVPEVGLCPVIMTVLPMLLDARDCSKPFHSHHNPMKKIRKDKDP